MTKGQAAYEEDCRRCPRYGDGSLRKSWAAQPEYVKWSWEKNPTPRNYYFVVDGGADRPRRNSSPW